MTTRRTLCSACAAALSLVASAALAQSSPTKPVVLVVPNPPGGSVGTSARIVGEPLAKIIGQAVVIENKPGASGNIAYQQVALIAAATNVIAVHPSIPSPYKGSGAAIQDVLGGQVQMFMTTPPSVMQHAQAGKLKALAVTGKTRHPGLPTVPTTAEAGLAGFEIEAWVGLFAPAGTPAPVIAQLSEAVRKALDTPEANANAARQGIELRHLGPDALAALVTRDTEYRGTLVESRHITAD